MKRIKFVLAVLFLILICFSLLSCQTQPFFEENETVTPNEVHFQEVISFDPLVQGLSDENYFDVTDFTVIRFDEGGDFGDGAPVVCFSYVPIELRMPAASSAAYTHNDERFSKLLIDNFTVTEVLKLLKDIKPICFLKPDSTQKESVLTSFSKQYGVAYSFKFTHNGKRDGEFRSISAYQTHYDFLISPLTKDNTYFLCNQTTLMVTEVDGEVLSFLGKSSEDWYGRYLFQKHIGFVEKIEVSIKNGTTDGIRGVKNLLLEHCNTDENGVLLHPLEVVNSSSNAVLHVTAHYNGETKSIGNILKYRKFYAGILWTEVRKIVLDESRQERLKNDVPDMTIKVSLKCDDYQETLEYRLFADNSVLLNGIYVGELTDGQLDALISAVGLMLSPNASDIIDFW